MDYKIFNLSKRREWKKYLEKLPREKQDVYFFPEYYELYEKNGDGEAFCFVFEDGKNLALYPFLRNKVNDLGFYLEDNFFDIQGTYGYNGVISSTYDEKFIKDFFNVFDNFCEDGKIIAEFTRFHPIIENNKFSEKYMEVYRNRKTVFLNLNQKENEIFENFPSPCKRAIAKANKSGVTIKIQTNEFDDEKFIELYEVTMNRVKAKKYLYFNRNYFRRIFKMKNVVLFLAIYKEETIALTLCFYSRNYFHYHLGASMPEFLHLRPNNILFFEMIKYAKNLGCEYIHFGGGNTDKENDSLFRFKSNFSKTYREFYIGTKLHHKKIYYEIVKQWEKRFPKKKDIYKNLFLKYRM